MNKNTFALLLSFVFIAATTHATPPASQTRQIIDNMLATISKHQGAIFTMHGVERMVGKPNENNQINMFTKVNIAPLKIYAKVLTDPNKGTELLYATGERGNKIRVNAGKFVPTLNLAPTSGLLSKNQHHTLLTSGFMIVSRIVSDGVKRADAQGKFDVVFQLQGETVFQGRKCNKVFIDDPSYTYTTVVGGKGETVHTLAKRLLISEYHIMELNPSSRGLDDNVEGKTLKVPTSYAKKTMLYIDKETNLPIYQEMNDEKGIFEKYEYTNVTLNPAFKADEFTDKFPDYHF
jgi:hypothetical protein